MKRIAVLVIALLVSLTACAPSDNTPAQFKGESVLHDVLAEPGPNDPEPMLPSPPALEAALEGASESLSKELFERVAMDTAMDLAIEHKGYFCGIKSSEGIVYELREEDGPAVFAGYSGEYPDFIQVVDEDGNPVKELSAQQAYTVRVLVQASELDYHELGDVRLNIAYRWKKHDSLRLIAYLYFGEPTCTAIYAEDFRVYSEEVMPGGANLTVSDAKFATLANLGDGTTTEVGPQDCVFSAHNTIDVALADSCGYELTAPITFGIYFVRDGLSSQIIPLTRTE